MFLFVLYIVAYIVNQAVGNKTRMHETYSMIQYGLGLTSPAANLARALFVATNSFEILCGKYGDSDTSSPGAYVRYGSPYANLIIQILFLILVLMLYEYGSLEWFRQNITHRGVPARLHYIVDTEERSVPLVVSQETEKQTRTAAPVQNPILSVSRISKFFGKLFAVENVSFNIAPNETLALLGGNGAGKTTVINMIRGELRPSFGDIFLDGVSVTGDPQRARSQMGVCPQDDAIDNLTVRQTLNFYATVKGLHNVSANVDKVLNALSITSFQSLSVKALSGGTRRKVTVAIALLGNPRILLLDEPSTGQDAGAKRILWRALSSIARNRAILLTTHSMEEAEALATNVAIVGTKMLATGTLTELQEIHGGNYCVRAVTCKGMSARDVEVAIRERFGESISGYAEACGQIKFGLPHERSALGGILRVLEELKGDFICERANKRDETAGNGHSSGATGSSAAGGSSAVENVENVRYLADYIVTGPTLEEVFMNVAREAGVGGSA